jgi:hypothetical protein
MQEMVLIVPYNKHHENQGHKNTRVCYRKQMQQQIGQRVM